MAVLEVEVVVGTVDITRDDGGEFAAVLEQENVNNFTFLVILIGTDYLFVRLSI